MERKEFIEIPRREDVNVEEALGIKKSAIEETLQSIDSTLKRIEKFLKEKSDVNVVMDGFTDALTKAVEQI